ncbi:hypothetical protein KDL44_10830 [bacterium]|nr:hypothetical protein [bacterium]
MKAFHTTAGISLSALLLGLGLAACGGGSDSLRTESTVLNQPTALESSERTVSKKESGFLTSAPAQAAALPGSELDLLPLLTVGDEVPLLTGSWPDLETDPSRTYGVAGIPDGLGWVQARGYNWVWVNHEMSAGNLSDFSSTVSGQINGARVSIFKFNSDWECLGGMNLINTIVDESGVIGGISLDGNTVSQSGHVFSRFCSGNLSTLFDHGQPVWLPGEETGGGRGWAIYRDGTALSIDDAQRCARENNWAMRSFRNETVLVGTDDSTNRPLVLYVGDRSHTDRDGFRSGSSWVLNIEDAAGNFISNTGEMLTGETYRASWALIPAEYYTNTAAYYAWTDAAPWRGTDFVRLEDGEEDPDQDGDFYFFTTGSNGTHDVYGALFRLEFNERRPTGSGRITRLAEGGPGSFISPDNLTISGGYIYGQEDVNGGAPLNQMIAEQRNGSVWRMDKDGGNQLRVITQDQTPYDGFNTAGELAANGISIWETSGIIEVGGCRGGSGLLFTVQAHSLNDPADMGGGNYVQGGQILLATGRPSSGHGHGKGHGNGHGHGHSGHGNGHGNGHGGH